MVILIMVFLSLQNSSTSAQKNFCNKKYTKIDTAHFLINDKAFSSSVTYLGDFASNLSGGKQTGSTYLGIASLSIGFETEKIGLWKGGEFFIHGAATHGGVPSKKLLGDFQVASNIEAGNHTYIQELYYKHKFEIAEFTIGLQDLNADFVVSEFAGSFINSSFGIPSLISSNVPVPIFPLTALGVSAMFSLSEDVTIRTAVFDGLPESFDSNEYNLGWRLNTDDGLLYFSELQYSYNLALLPGSIKAGGYFHTHLKTVNEDNGVKETLFNKNYGFYLIADQTIARHRDGDVGLFTQFAVSPSDRNDNHYFLGGGLIYTGLLNKNGNDELGVAAACAGFCDKNIYNETTIELFYKYPMNENLFIQPDLQYIINPASGDVALNNALAAIIRFGINF